MTRTGVFGVSGLLVICEHEYNVEKVILPEYKSALFGMISWIEKTNVLPRSLDNLTIKSLWKVFKRNVLSEMKKKNYQRRIE